MSVQTMQPVQQSMDSLFATATAATTVTNSIPQVSMDEIRTKAFIGKGSFSKVYEVECKQPHQRSNGLPMSTLAFAMKCLDPKQVGKCPVKHEIATQDIEYESNILSQLDHPNIVKLHAISPHRAKRQLPKRLSSSLSASSSASSSSSSLSSMMSLTSLSSHGRRSRSSSRSRSEKGTIGKYLVLELLEDTLADRLHRWRFHKKNKDKKKKEKTASNKIPLQRQYSNGKKSISRVLNRSLSFRSSRSSSTNNLADLASSVSSSSKNANAAGPSDAAVDNTSGEVADLLVRSEVVRNIPQRPNMGKSMRGLQTSSAAASSSLSTSCNARLATLASDSTKTVNSLESSAEDDENEQQLDRVRQPIPGLVSAMVYLHDQDLVFRDIKPQNVGFVTSKSNSKVKLYDFGLCRKTNECSDDEIVGTFRYMAPERMVFRRKSLIRRSMSDLSVMIDEPSDDELKMPSPQTTEPVIPEADVRRSNMLKAADVYGIGVMMWEVATLERPYEELLCQKNMMRSDLHVKLHRRGWRHSTEQIHCPKLRSLIEQCWHVDPAERPTMYEVSEILDDIFS